jgi:hypothetical protein
LNTDLRKVVRVLAQVWYLGYLHTDAERLLMPSAAPPFDFQGVSDHLRHLDFSSQPRAISGWINRLRARADLRGIYRKAVQSDLESEQSSDYLVSALLFELMEAGNAYGKRLSLRKVLPLHIAGIAITCHLLHQNGQSFRFVPGQKRIFIDHCRSLADVIDKIFWEKNYKEQFESLAVQVSNLYASFSASASGREADLALCLTVLYARWLVSGRSSGDRRYSDDGAGPSKWVQKMLKKAGDRVSIAALREALIRGFQDGNFDSVSEQLAYAFCKAYQDPPPPSSDATAAGAERAQPRGGGGNGSAG